MSELEDFLSQARVCVELDRKCKAEAMLRGEAFNVFDILGLSTKETPQSAFIAELLNPQGCHGCGTIFLQLFLSQIECLKDWHFNTENVIAEIERPVGYRNLGTGEGGRLDIVVENEEQMIIIESKINAGDQPQQLLRYQNYAKQFGKDYRILYLTLDGHNASEISTLNKLEPDKDYYSISFSSDILTWLQHCLEQSAERPIVYNTILQYINLVKRNTHQDMEKFAIENFYDTLLQGDNLEIAKAVRDNLARLSDYIASRLESKFQNSYKPFAQLWRYTERGWHDVVFENFVLRGVYIKMDIWCYEDFYDIVIWSPEDRRTSDTLTVKAVIGSLPSLQSFVCQEDNNHIKGRFGIKEEANLISFINQFLQELRSLL